MNRQRLRSVIGSSPAEDRDSFDTLAIVLCTYFSDHQDRPKDDPDTENGWGEWVEQKTNWALDEIVRNVLRLSDNGSG